MKKKLTLVIAAVIILVSTISIYMYNQGYFMSGIKECPDAWIDNQMPSIGKGVTEYLIVGGKRQEMKDYNLQWIENNCSVSQPSIVF